jgi:hypothetical protein
MSEAEMSGAALQYWTAPRHRRGKGKEKGDEEYCEWLGMSLRGFRCDGRREERREEMKSPPRLRSLIESAQCHGGSEVGQRPSTRACSYASTSASTHQISSRPTLAPSSSAGSTRRLCLRPRPSRRLGGVSGFGSAITTSRWTHRTPSIVHMPIHPFPLVLHPARCRPSYWSRCRGRRADHAYVGQICTSSLRRSTLKSSSRR